MRLCTRVMNMWRTGQYILPADFGFNPKQIFVSGVQGAFYRERDISTLYLDYPPTVPVTGMEQQVATMLDISGRGNHAFQTTLGKRPVYSRRVNLLTKTEDFTNAAWTAGKSAGASAASNTTLAPNGTMTADTVTFAASTDYLYQPISGFTASVGGSIVLRHCSKVTGRLIALGGATPAGTDVHSYEDIGGGWYEHKTTRTFTVAATGTIQILPSGSIVGAGSFAVWGASLTLAIDASLPYQWVNTATDYDADATRFPSFLLSDGISYSMQSSTGGGGTAGFFFSAAVTPLGGAGTMRVLFSDAGANTGYIVRLNASNQLELAVGNGTGYTTVATTGTLAVGSTDIIQAWDDGATLSVKIGTGPTASVARPAVVAGTAGFTLGQDNGASSGYFNGRVYSTVYTKDTAITQAQRDSVAAYQRVEAFMP